MSEKTDKIIDDYIVNLEEDAHKWQKAVKQLEEKGIELKFDYGDILTLSFKKAEEKIVIRVEGLKQILVAGFNFIKEQNLFNERNKYHD